MWNIDFASQLEKSREHLFGFGCICPREVSDQAFRESYVPHSNIEVVPCFKDMNGEYVPRPMNEE
jgi:hypothetical protein